MKKFLLLLLLLLLATSPALAANRVIDDAGLLSPQQESQLEEAIAEIARQYQFDVVLLLKQNIGNQAPRYYAADYYDYGGYGYNSTKDGIMLLLVTGAGVGNRDYCILNTGLSESIFTDGVLYDIEEDILPYLSRSSYYTALQLFVSRVAERLHYMNRSPLERANALFPVLAVGGLIIALIVVFALKSQMKTVRRKKGAASYVREGSFQLTRVQDVYLYTTTHRQRIETNSSGGGHGGGGFTGSSGTHHTSHSGKF